MKNRIYFYANFGDWKKPPYGGGEAGNRKTYELLKQMDVEIRLISKYKHSDDNSILGKILSIVRVITNLIQFFLLLLCGRRKNSIVHISGYYGGMIWFERILVTIAKSFGYYLVYEMRAGGASYKYDNFGKKWRKDFCYIINAADVIFSQGQENIPLLKSLKPDAEIFYYPNYVMTGYYPEVYCNKLMSNLGIMYFGRLSEQKNIELIVDAFNLVAEELEDAKLLIVGNFITKEYQDKVETKISDSAYKDRVTILPALKREDLISLMRDQHIYLFPSAEPGEGHSNALTEAMAWGLVPIASPQGFNRSIVNEDCLIIDKYDAVEYANAIIKIVRENKFEEYSKKCYNRVMELYRDIKASERLSEQYQKMFWTVTQQGKGVN